MPPPLKGDLRQVLEEQRCLGLVDVEGERADDARVDRVEDGVGVDEACFVKFFFRVFLFFSIKVSENRGKTRGKKESFFCFKKTQHH